MKMMFREKWGRRVAVGVVWVVLNYVTVYIQPILKIDNTSVQLLINKSVWLAAVLVVGLSGTDAMENFLKAKNGGGKIKNDRDEEST